MPHLLFVKYPQQQGVPLQMPAPAEPRIFRLDPVVLTALDYIQGFGHTDLVAC